MYIYCYIYCFYIHTNPNIYIYIYIYIYIIYIYIYIYIYTFHEILSHQCQSSSYFLHNFQYVKLRIYEECLHTPIFFLNTIHHISELVELSATNI